MPSVTPLKAMLLAALPFGALSGTTGSADPEQHARPRDELTVVTLNIYHDRADWPSRRPLVLEGLKVLRPDVIVLQEVLQHESLRNQAEDLGDVLGYESWFVSANPPGDERRFGNAILTPHPVLERTGQPLEPRDDWRTLAHARVDIRGNVVDVYGTHLHHTLEGSDIRARQVHNLLSLVAARDDGTPALLAGDFNATVTTPELAPLFTRYFDVFGSTGERGRAQDVGKTADFTTLNPQFFEAAMQRRIDHVLAERGRFEVLEARRVLDRPDEAGTWPSDHFGVYARLRVVAARE